MSSAGRWDKWYAGLDPDVPVPYGDTTTYAIAEQWLADLAVEDWGCGRGFFRTVHRGPYLGIDGSKTPFADKIVDLCTYRSATEGLLLRHVIEHNDGWQDLLANAVGSTTHRMALILFTPMADRTAVIARPAPRRTWRTRRRAAYVGVPDISFNHDELMGYFDGFTTSVQDHETETQYGTERVYLLERNR